MRKFTITVDVEACNRSRVSSDYVKRLIWGDFQDGAAPAGIGRMMDIGDRTGVPFTMFLDIAESTLYGDQIAEVGKYILDRGHDLQLHLHPEVIPEDIWQSWGLCKPEQKRNGYRLDSYTYEEAKVVMWYFCEMFESWFGRLPVSFRGGAFRTNRNFVRMQEEIGVPLSSNHSYSNYVNQRKEPLQSLEKTLFRWSKDVVEVGVSQVVQEDGVKVMAIPSSIEKTASWRAVLANEAKKPVCSGPVVFLLHSWSLLNYSPGKGRFFDGVSEYRAAKLEKICEIASEFFDCTNFTSLNSDINAGVFGELETHYLEY